MIRLQSMMTLAASGTPDFEILREEELGDPLTQLHEPEEPQMMDGGRTTTKENRSLSGEAHHFL